MKRFWVAVLSLMLTVAASQSDAKTFRYAYRIDPASLDPHALAETFTLSWLGQIYEPLVGRGKNLELVPALATKWEQPNPTTWRFHLRPNVKFHNGESFSADDVIFSVTRMKAEGSDMAYTVATVTEVKKIDDLTVDFILAKPNPILPLQTTSTYMMSKAWAEKNNAAMPASIKNKQENFATSNANGTGAFKIASRQVGVKTDLRAPMPAGGGRRSTTSPRSSTRRSSRMRRASRRCSRAKSTWSIRSRSRTPRASAAPASTSFSPASSCARSSSTWISRATNCSSRA